MKSIPDHLLNLSPEAQKTGLLVLEMMSEPIGPFPEFDQELEQLHGHIFKSTERELYQRFIRYHRARYGPRMKLREDNRAERGAR
jgi:hypothetical protein